MKSVATRLPARLPKTFAALSELRPPRPIAGAAGLADAGRIINRLAVVGRPTQGQADYLETLTMLVERYEAEHEPKIDAGDVEPVDALRYLMDAHGLRQSDVGELLGVGPSAVSMILSGRRPITLVHARKLGERFAVRPTMFVGL